MTYEKISPADKTKSQQGPAGAPGDGPSLDEALARMAAAEAYAKQLETDYVRLFKSVAGASRKLAERDSTIQDQQSTIRRIHATIVHLIWTADTLHASIGELQSTAQQQLYGLGHAASRAWAQRRNLRLMLGDLWISARRARMRPRRALGLFRQIRLVRASGWLDAEFYAPQKAASPEPLLDDARNYVFAGRGLAPNRMFSGQAYLEAHPDLKVQDMTPLEHFIAYGAAEGRLTVPAVRRPPTPPTVPLEPLPVLMDVSSDPAPDDRTPYEWPLATHGHTGRSVPPRPDDVVLAEGEKGRAFISRHDLLGSSPDFAGAVEELKAMAEGGGMAWADGMPPRASIVIPVYGQLPYTLNCLHSLFAQNSRFGFEVLVGDDASVDETERYLRQVPGIRYIRHAANAGFIDNCNTTAALARGDYIVLLNNDTRVVEGWLDEMIGSFDLFPNAGMVGSKLFYDDGVLQEAGGIFWGDGSAWNYGRGDDPNRPGYCYARQVDYVSGAAIAVPTALWKDLGGFDELYRPAYAEDADMAFRIRAMGRQTWMQPLSRVIHYEGRTSGTDLSQGVKAYQVDNLRKFGERWAQDLTAFRPSGWSPVLERERDVQKRVLVLDAITPNANEDAGSVLAITYLRLYQELGYKVYFIPAHNFLYRPQITDELRRMGIECIYEPYYSSLEQFLRPQGQFMDLVHIFRVGVASESMDLIREHAAQAPVIFHNVDMHYLRLERQAAIESDSALLEIARQMKRIELKITEEADCSVVLSTVEDQILKVEAPNAEVAVFPFLTPVVGTAVGFADRRDVMFLGGYRHPPNVDAALFLANEVWPRVRSQLPGARLLIVGGNAPQEVKDLASDHIVVTGQVDDLRPYFDRARVFAASIRYGAGIKGKVATAMSYGVPVVATTIAAEGMSLVDGRDVLIADDADQIASAIINVYHDPSEWVRLSNNGLTFVDENNSTAMGRRILAEIIHRASYRHARRMAAKWISEGAA